MYLVYQTLFAHAFGDEGLHFTLYTWIPAGSFQIDFNFAVDALTAVLLIVVTTIGMLVHVYSIGYMAHDAEPLALLRLSQPLHVQHVAARAGRQLHAAVRGVGAGRPVESTC